MSAWRAVAVQNGSLTMIVSGRADPRRRGARAWWGGEGVPPAPETSRASGAPGSYLSLQGLGPLPRAELCCPIGAPVEAAFRHRGVELEGPPPDAEVEVVLHQGGGLLQSALSDVAPRTDHVRDDLDGQRAIS